MKRTEQSRVENLKKVMTAEGIAALVVTKRENVRYLTGFTGSWGSVLITRERLFLITDFRYKIQAGKETTGVAIHIQKKDFYDAVREAAEEAKAGTLWLDESSLTIEGMKKLRKQGLVVKTVRDLVGELRQRKDPQEITSIRRAIRRAEESFRELKKYIRPGVRERELAVRLEFLMREKGAKRPAFDTIVASGRNGAMPHASVTDRRIKRGELVTIDFGAEADGYFSDITRTICVGRPSPRQRQIHELVLSAQASALQAVRPGVACVSVDQAARDTIKKAGQGNNFGHGTGHGVGLMVHEKPAVSTLSTDRVEEGMVFTIEPGVYIPGWGGVRIEDMVWVARNGARVLTTLPRELQ